MRVLSYHSQAKFETTFKWKPAKITRERAGVCDRFAWKILQRKKHFECATTSGHTSKYLADRTNEMWYRNNQQSVGDLNLNFLVLLPNFIL